MSIKMENPTAAPMEEDDNCYQISDDDDFEDDLGLPDDNGMASTSRIIDSDGQSGFIRGPYERAWTGDATRALIHIRGPMEDKFNEGRQKRTTLWLYVTKQLHRLGFRYSAAKVQKKWHNILITYNKNIAKKEEVGYVHWEFFEEMWKYLKGRRAQYDQRIASGDFHMKMSPEAVQQRHQQIIQQQRLQQQQRIQQHQQRVQQIKREEIILKPENQLSKIQIPEPLTNSNGHQSYDEVEDDDDDDEDPLESSTQKKNIFDHTGSLPLQISHVIGGDGGQQNNQFHPKPQLSAEKKPLPEDLLQDTAWWRDHFEKKLMTEREKLKLQKEIHRDLMNFNRMSLMQQEKIERIKIDAINSLTSTLQKLVETKQIHSIKK